MVFILLTIFSGSELRAMSIEQESPKAQCSQLIAQSNINYDDSVSFYESQIRIADSLYKNYLPQSNFEEVKAAVEFFDSLRLSKTTDNSQQTTDFVQWWTTDNSQQTTDIFHRSKTKSCTSDAYSRTVDCCPLSVDFSCAKAHYYHAVGLTEKDDIVGACEHYLIALEIMEDMMAKDKREEVC